MDKLAGLFGGGSDNGAALAQQQAAATTRTTLASMAQNGAAADAAGLKAGAGRIKGRQLLSFLGAQGASGVGAA